MKKIYLMWAYSDQISLGIYSNNLKKTFNDMGYNVNDFRRKVTSGSIIKILKDYMRHLLKIYQEVEDDSNNRIIDIHNIAWIPPLLLGFRRAKHIVIVHDFFYYDKDFFKDKKWIAKLMYYYYNTIHKFLYRITFRRCEKIIAISNGAKQEIIEKFWSSFQDKIEVVYNGMDISSFKPKKDQKPHQTPYLLYVGSELGRKNLKNIISAFALIKKDFPDLKLIKAPTENVAEYRNKTLEYIKENNLTIGEDVILVDEYLPLEKLIELYQEAEVFLFPTRKEGFWFPIIEAQACGTPVITTHYEPMCELVPYKNMTVNPLDPEEIAEKTIKILKDKKLREKMIQDGLDYVTKFTRENTVKGIIKIIEQ